MFLKTGEYEPEIHQKFTEKITSFHKADETLLIGREDGVVECIDCASFSLNEKLKKICRVKAFEPSFDCLENEDIKEKITAMALCTDGGVNSLLFTGNEKNLKSFRIRQNLSTLELCLNKETKKTVNKTESFRTQEIHSRGNVHSYVLNSIALNLNKEFLITSDYIKVNLWKPERLEHSLCLLDIKQQIAGGFIHVLNTSKFSSFHDNIFGYSSSIGELSLNDLSISPKSHKILTFKNTYNHCIKSISDFVFVDPNFVLTRSMNNLCLFDQRNPKREVYMVELVNSVEEQNTLNSGDAVYDKFKIDFNGHFAYTGAYSGSVYCLDLLSNKLEEIEVDSEREKIKHVVANRDGFSCVSGGRVINYRMDESG